MKQNILRRQGHRFCVAEIEIENGRFSLCGVAGSVWKRNQAKLHALQYWVDFFEDNPNERREMNERFYTVDASEYITAANVPASHKYAYGSQWLRFDLPADLEARLADIIAPTHPQKTSRNPPSLIPRHE